MRRRWACSPNGGHLNGDCWPFLSIHTVMYLHIYIYIMLECIRYIYIRYICISNIYIYEILLDSTNIQSQHRNHSSHSSNLHRTNCHHPRHRSNCQTTTTRDGPCWLFRENTRLGEHWTPSFFWQVLFFGIKGGIQSSPSLKPLPLGRKLRQRIGGLWILNLVAPNISKFNASVHSSATNSWLWMDGSSVTVISAFLSFSASGAVPVRTGFIQVKGKNSWNLKENN